MSDYNARTERSKANIALIELIEDTEHQLSMARAALVSIAQYDPRWTGQKVSNVPSRSQLIAKAYDDYYAL